MPEKKSLNGYAWRMYPEPDGTEYSAKDCRNEEIVEELFDFCQILEAVIFAKGWQLLFKTYGMEGLLQINKRSGWFDDSNATEAKEEFLYHSRSAGYDPERDVFGLYHEDTGVFTLSEEKA